MNDQIARWRAAFYAEQRIRTETAGDPRERVSASVLCRVLACGSPEEIALEFEWARACDPVEVARLGSIGPSLDLSVCAPTGRQQQIGTRSSLLPTVKQ